MDHVVDAREWLEADGLGGFASGTVLGPRTRRYHGLLVTSEPDGSRYALVNGAEVSLQTAAGTWALSSQAYTGGLIHPDGARWCDGFASEPWPQWTFAFPDGTRLAAEIVAQHRHPRVLLRWTLLGLVDLAVPPPAILRVRPLLSGRDYHALHHENPHFQFQPVGGQGAGGRPGQPLVFRPYPGVPGILLAGNGQYRHDPRWYRRFHYAEEAARGLDFEEDLAAPGELTFDLGQGAAELVLARVDERSVPAAALAPSADEILRAERERRARFPTPLHRAADAYVIHRGGGKTILAGYPWFTDWGRDTFIALRGLCLATGRLEDARAVLLRWADTLRDGLLPNRFPDGGGAPEYNSVDAALWYVVAVLEYLEAAPRPTPMSVERRRLLHSIEAILEAHVRGLPHRIGIGSDGLLAAGDAGVQLTWMDARIGDWVVTPRTGKPVEVQALWLNALDAGVRLGAPSAQRWRDLLERGRRSFVARFWDAQAGQLHDVVDVDHVPGRIDATHRANQILAVGGLPLALLEGPQARAVVDAVEAQLLTPLGLRTLAPGEPGYHPRYGGNPFERDSAYHQGTVWPWLMGPFVEAWVRVRGDTQQARAAARARFLPALRAHLPQVGIGHVSEVADAEAPHRPGGCPFQAWSVGELLRLELTVLTGATGRPGQ